ncbi:T-complex protein 1 subunit theta [Polyplax serrata]|uniref:T-complex protein 1 subunit theta n=1 Tax=Polyplax serrata TaxID=468196 RepID=A0AAN8RT85_POLSC
MALHIPKPPGVMQMLKDGARYFQGLDEAVFRNISACKEFAQTVRTAYGPNGMNKMVINHLEKLFVTSDAATIIKELDVEHPAAKLMILASQMQEQEIGDGTNFVIIFCGALLEAAEDMLRMGLTPSEVTQGYELALEKTLEILPGLTCFEVKDTKSEKEIVQGMKTAIMSKQFGQEYFLTKLIAKACISILPEKTTFNVDNIRVCKILGAGLLSSHVVNGMVFKRYVEGEITKHTKAKIAVYTCPIDISQTETKGTVLIKTAQELKDFSRGEECLLEDQIKAIADTGVNVIVAGGKFGDMVLHYMNKYKLMAVRLHSKFDVRRICKTVGATALPRMTAPTPEEIGYADAVYVDEVGDTSVTVFQLDGQDSKIATIVVRGSTDNYMDDIERAIDDGVNTFKAITRDGRFLPGAGATEIELARQISSFADTRPGLDQYAIKRFAYALEMFPKALAENSGVNANEVITKLYAAHEEGKKTFGFDITGDSSICDAAASGILDLYITKYWALKYAVNAASTILKVDQIIMAKRAGGPKNKPSQSFDDD